MRLLHPAHSDGFVSFALGDEGSSAIPRYAVRSSHLSDPVPLSLSKDSYVSINQAGEVWEAETDI